MFARRATPDVCAFMCLRSNAAMLAADARPKPSSSSHGRLCKPRRGSCVERGANHQIAHDGPAPLYEIIKAEIGPQQPIAAEARDQAEGKGLDHHRPE